jgi:hypothetical protein
VSLISMGLAGLEPTAEDDLCAEYIRSRILGQPLAGMPERIADLARTDGAKVLRSAEAVDLPAGGFRDVHQAGSVPVCAAGASEE